MAITAMLNELERTKINGCNFYLNPISIYPMVVDYGDSEGCDDMYATARSLVYAQRSVKVPLMKNDYSSAEKAVEEYKSRIDTFLNTFPRIFSSYGTYASVYYTYNGCVEYSKGNVEQAKESFLKGMIYESLFIVGSLSLRTYKAILNHYNKNCGNKKNFNLIYRRDIITQPFDDIGFSNMAGVIIGFLLHCSEAEVLSRAAVYAYCKYVLNLLEIAVQKGELSINPTKDLKAIIQNTSEIVCMDANEWNKITPVLKALQRSIGGLSSIIEITAMLKEKYDKKISK